MSSFLRVKFPAWALLNPAVAEHMPPALRRELARKITTNRYDLHPVQRPLKPPPQRVGIAGIDAFDPMGGR